MPQVILFEHQNFHGKHKHIFQDEPNLNADDDNEFNDWIEIHNPASTPVDLTDWALTDEVAKPTKWKFPAVTLQPGDFLMVWASGKDKRTPGLPLHTNFSLAKDGEYLALVRPDGTTVERHEPGICVGAERPFDGVGGERV